MKKARHLVLGLTLVLHTGIIVIAQCVTEEDTIPQYMLSGDFESRNGWYMTPHDTMRVLAILVEIEYSNPDSLDPGSPSTWLPGQLPDWVDNADPSQNLFEAHPLTGAAQGRVTRYYQQASSGGYVVLADYLMAPDSGDNNGVFKFSSLSHEGDFQGSPPVNMNRKLLIDHINSQLAGNLTGNTYYGYDDLDDFDKWIIGTLGSDHGPGKEKEKAFTESPRKYDHVAVFCRNCRSPGGNSGLANSGNIGGASLLFGYGSNSWSVCGPSRDPTNVFRHEFGHLLYGGNNFHTGGGGYATGGMYFIMYSSGWSNLGLNGASLMSWNGWDRQRMGWKDPMNTYLVSARDTAMAEVNGDLDATVPGHAKNYILRDFVLTGDALRIKLPFTDPMNEFPEWLWIENHQGRSLNGVPFDKWQYDHHACVDSMAPGLQMYVQIDRDVRQATTYGAIYGGYGDHLRPLDASGHFDRTFTDPELNFCGCWNCAVPPVIRQLPNPLTGLADRHAVPVDLNDNNVIPAGEHLLNWLERIGEDLHDEIHGFGHNRQVFTLDGNNKLGVGTNPSSATMMNIVGYSNDITESRNLRKIYLNGAPWKCWPRTPMAASGCRCVSMTWTSPTMHAGARTPSC
jgi:hypothetical protein